MATLTVQGSGTTDCYIDSNSPTVNTNNTTLAVGEQKSATITYRTLLKFDLSSIPYGSTVNSATLTMYSDGQDLSDASRTMRVYRVLRVWDETQATWNVYTTGNNWGTAGCANTTTDREASDIGSVTHAANPSDGDPFAITLTASSIQEMTPGGSFTNNGFLLKMDTESDDAGGFHSSSYATSGQRPKLVVDYNPGSSRSFFSFM